MVRQTIRHVSGNRLLVTDPQNSPLRAVGSGDLAAVAYCAYGHRVDGEGLSGLPGFNGERADPLTGHYLLGNGYRAFSPVLMRFNSPDSWSPFGGGGLNAYAYCGGDPVNRKDPSGHIKVPLVSVWRKPALNYWDLNPATARPVFRDAPGSLRQAAAQTVMNNFHSIGRNVIESRLPKSTLREMGQVKSFGDYMEFLQGDYRRERGRYSARTNIVYDWQQFSGDQMPPLMSRGLFEDINQHMVKYYNGPINELVQRTHKWSRNHQVLPVEEVAERLNYYFNRRNGKVFSHAGSANLAILEGAQARKRQAHITDLIRGVRRNSI